MIVNEYHVAHLTSQSNSRVTLILINVRETVPDFLILISILELNIVTALEKVHNVKNITEYKKN